MNVAEFKGDIMNFSKFFKFVPALLLLPALVQAAGQAEWEKQVNDGFGQARQSMRGMKGQDRAAAERYLNQAESEWNKLKSNQMWYIKQQYQQQNQLNNSYLQQQNLNLFMQQQMLKNQAVFKTPSLKTINPFGDYLFHGVSLHPEDGRLHGPGTIADTPALANLFQGSKILDETRRLENAKKTASGSAAAQAASIKNTGLWDNPVSGNAKTNPYAGNSGVVDLRNSKSLTPKLPGTDDSKQSGTPITAASNPYAAMSDERLDKKREVLTEALRKTQKISEESARGYSQLENDATEGKGKAWQAVQDSITTAGMGISQSVADKNSMNTLFNAVNTGAGPGKIDAMRASATASKLAKDVENAGKVGDVDAFTDAANKGNLDDAAGQGAIMLGNALVKSPTRLTPGSPIGAVPGAAKVGIDTAFVWTDYYVLNKDSQRQELLAKQIEANRQKLSRQLQEVIEEQKRRNAAGK